MHPPFTLVLEPPTGAEVTAALRRPRAWLGLGVLLAALGLTGGGGWWLLRARVEGGGGTEGVPLSIASEPPGAAVWVDGHERGRTPLTVAVAPGPHALLLRLEGRIDASSPRTPPTRTAGAIAGTTTASRRSWWSPPDPGPRSASRGRSGRSARGASHCRCCSRPPAGSRATRQACSAPSGARPGATHAGAGHLMGNHRWLRQPVRLSSRRAAGGFLAPSRRRDEAPLARRTGGKTRPPHPHSPRNGGHYRR